ncbi:MAG TPA: hypothetical protein VLK82_08185 [Candidatus Tectomicrobia bacterium]|nr:hypothetical protein [Candidatus Tectomicrobia bacterium]
MTTQVQRFEPRIAEQQDDELVAHHRQFTQMQLRYLIPADYAGGLMPTAAVPDQVLLGSLHDGRLRVQAAIPDKLTTEREHLIAGAVEFEEFGFGRTLSEALVDLQRAIAELYFAFEQEQQRLGPDLQHVWGQLQQKIVKRP